MSFVLVSEMGRVRHRGRRDLRCAMGIWWAGGGSLDGGGEGFDFSVGADYAVAGWGGTWARFLSFFLYFLNSLMCIFYDRSLLQIAIYPGVNTCIHIYSDIQPHHLTNPTHPYPRSPASLPRPPLPPLLPPSHPTRTIHTPHRPLTLPLPTIPTLNLPLYDIVPTPLTIHARHDPQHHRNEQKPHHLIQKIPIREHHRAVGQRLLLRVVPVGDGPVVVGAVQEGCEFLVEVAGEEGEEGDEGEEDVGYEGGGDGGEGGGEAGRGVI